jgi:hypothetical protein
MTDKALIDWMGEHSFTLHRFVQPEYPHDELIVLYVAGLRDPIRAPTIREALEVAFRETI